MSAQPSPRETEVPASEAGGEQQRGLSGAGGIILALIEAMRPRQWTKNVLVFAGLLFTLDRPHVLADAGRAFLAFVLFCLLSGGVYLLNDLIDIEADRQHPRKRLRPIASGRLPRSVAAFAATALPLLALLAAWTINLKFFAAALCYVLVTLAYTFFLKHQVILDILALASGFVLRAAAGSFAVGVANSEWLLLCTTLLALFLGLAKRRGEIAALGDSPATRRILADYSLPMLDQMITIVAACCIMSYALYTFFSNTGQSRPYLMATLPFVIYGLFRYLYLVHRKGEGETPETVLLKDMPTLLNVVLFVLAAMCIILATGR